MSIWDSYKKSSLNPINIFSREDPAKDANKYLDQIPGIGEKYYNPFIEGGRKAGGILDTEYGRMLNPTSFIDDIMSKYSLSKGAQYERDKLGKGIGATAAAGGFAGTPEHQQEYGEMADKIMSGDMQQYLQNALGVYGQGISGERDFYNKGYDASNSLADMLAGVLGSKSGLAFKSASDTNKSRDAFANALIKALAGGTGVFSGSGGAGADGAGAGVSK